MLRVAFRSGLAGVILVAGLSLTLAQDVDKYRDLFRKPETPLEFWNAITFELDVGRNDLAAKHLRGLILKAPAEKDLLTIVDKVGLTPILRLRLISEWSKDAKEDKQARDDAKKLIDDTTAANRKRLTDPARMRELVSKLLATPEEKTYGLVELYKAGAIAVPYLIEAYNATTDAGERLMYRKGLESLGPDALAPMLAALDSEATLLKLDLLTIISKRYVRYREEIIPHLWYASASSKQPEDVRKKAKSILADFLEIDEARLPPAKFALTREAEKYLNKKIAFGDPTSVTVWRWDGKAVVQGFPGAPTMPATQAEEYYGLRYAQQALNLDPAYRPAQLVFLTLALERAMDRAGPAAPLSRTSPTVAELLAKASPELVVEVIDRAIKEKRTGVVLAGVRALGERAETRAKKPTGRGEPALVQALYYPDVRVQTEAALALLRIPGPPAPRTAARIVEILTRVLKPSAVYRPGRKVLVAIAEEGYRDKVRDAIAETGATPVLVTNGREAMRQLREHAEIEAILLDSTLPHPGLAQILAQFRADVDSARLPVLLAALPETPASRQAAAKSRVLQGRLDAIANDTRRYRASVKGVAANESTELAEVRRDFAKDKKLTEDERQGTLRRIEEKFAKQREEIENDFPLATKLLKDEPKIRQELDREIQRYDSDSQLREAALERLVRPYQGIRVVHASVLTEAKSIESALKGMKKDALPPPTPAESTEAAERAMNALADLAEGKPAGYDVNAVAEVILDALQAGRLSPEGQIAGIRTAVELTGERPQRVLATVGLDGKRTPNVRLAALRGLTVNIQKQGRKLTGGDIVALDALSRQAGLDAKLKDQLAHLVGSLRPSEKATGELLRDHKVTPTPALPPPK